MLKRLSRLIIWLATNRNFGWRIQGASLKSKIFDIDRVKTDRRLSKVDIVFKLQTNDKKKLSPVGTKIRVGI